MCRSKDHYRNASNNILNLITSSYTRVLIIFKTKLDIVDCRWKHEQILIILLLLIYIPLIFAHVQQSDTHRYDIRHKHISSSTKDPNPRNKILNGHFSPAETLNLRLQQLELFAKSKPRPGRCSYDFVNLTSTYGRTNNQLIQIAHSLWAADINSKTLILPYMMRHTLRAFNLEVLKELFCVVFLDEVTLGSNSTTYDLSSGDAFALKDSVIQKGTVARDLKLPGYNVNTIRAMSKYFLYVYSALWSQPVAPLRRRVIRFIESDLNNSLCYTAVHKRSLEGGCSKIMAVNVALSSFSPKEIDMKDAHWSGPINISHPMCELPASFVGATISVNKRNKLRPIFVAHDGNADCSDLHSMGARFSHGPRAYDVKQSSVVDGASLNSTDSSTEYRSGRATDATLHVDMDTLYLDMMLAIHADLFLLNPASTLSWTVFVVRAALGLDSVPALRQRDFYLRGPSEINALIDWVGWDSIKRESMLAAQTLRCKG